MSRKARNLTAQSPTILVFDSGLGGLTVFREIVPLRPDARFVYAADDAGFPYGRLSERELSERVVSIMGTLIETHRPDLIVIACNTASTLVLTDLRSTFTVPFVGTVPAIKPACAASQTKLVSVLGTEATVVREYTKKLIADFGQGCDVTLVGSRRLAVLAEALLRGEAGRRRRHRRRDHALLCRTERPAHRYRGAGLYALSAA